jgi:LuxR family maltose regulon positive regulatory protein
MPPGSVAVIVSPPGYGATTLLSVAAEANPGPVVWLAGRGHAGPAESLWRQLVAGLAATGATAPDVPTDPGADQEANHSAIHELIAAAGETAGCLLILDDLPREPLVEAMVQQILEVLPASMRIMISSSALPRLDLSRLAGAGRLVLLERADLVLSEGESEEYLRMVAPGLRPQGRAALSGLAEGWFAALRASTSAAGADPGADPASWLLGPGLDLLFGPALADLDPQDRHLLVVCSVLDQMSPELCDAMPGCADSAGRLVSLCDRLTVRRVPGAGAARYETHPLMREFLIRKLSERGGGAKTQAYEAAGHWFAEHGDAERAISHLLEAGRIEQAREVLASHVRDLLDSGHSERVRMWFRRAPELAVPDHELLQLGAAWSELLGGNVAAAGPHLVELDAAAAKLRSSAPEAGSPAFEASRWLAVQVLFLRSYLEAWTGQTRRATDHVRAVRDIFGTDWSWMAHQASAFLQVRLDLGRGDPSTAGRALLHLSSRPGTLQFYRRIALPSLGGLVAAEEGRAHRACFLADSALQALAESGGIGAVDHCDAQLARARALTDLADPVGAAASAAAVQDTAAEVQHVPYLVLGAVARARALASGAQRSAAVEQLEAASASLSRHSADGPLGQQVHRARVEIAVMSGDRAEARHAVARLPQDRNRDLLEIRVLAMGGSVTPTDVVRAAQRVRPASPREVVAARLAMAAATAATRRVEAAMHLREAAGLAYEQGMLLALRGCSEEVLVLASDLAAQGADPSLAALVDALHRSLEPALPLAAALSPGERHLLLRLGETVSNRELAADLGISLNTLKTRLRRLYAKLGVHDRDAALHAARRGS